MPVLLASSLACNYLGILHRWLGVGQFPFASHYNCLSPCCSIGRLYITVSAAEPISWCDLVGSSFGFCVFSSSLDADTAKTVEEESWFSKTGLARNRQGKQPGTALKRSWIWQMLHSWGKYTACFKAGVVAGHVECIFGNNIWEETKQPFQATVQSQRR